MARTHSHSSSSTPTITASSTCTPGFTVERAAGCDLARWGLRLIFEGAKDSA
jgi:hypothetical protein